MKISQKGLYALEALTRLAQIYPRAAKIRQIAAAEDLPEKFLELILLDLKTARFVQSQRGPKGGYRLRHAPSTIFLGDVIRTVDGPLAPLGDAESLRYAVKHERKHRELFRVFLNVRNAVADILDHTSLADLCRSSGRRKA